MCEVRLPYPMNSHISGLRGRRAPLPTRLTTVPCNGPERVFLHDRHDHKSYDRKRCGAEIHHAPLQSLNFSRPFSKKVTGSRRLNVPASQAPPLGCSSNISDSSRTQMQISSLYCCLGVWAAVGFNKKSQNFDLSEWLRLHYFEVAKGSSTFVDQSIITTSEVMLNSVWIP